MKWFVLLGISLLFFSASGFAETVYVGEIVNITVRTGKGTDHKIIEMVRSGQKVEIVEPGAGWTKIRLKDGKSGWVLTRLLTDEPPNSVRLEKLKREHEALLVRVKEPLTEIKNLEMESNQLKQKLAETENSLLDLSRSYEDLKKQSAGFSRLKANYQTTTAQLTEMRKKNGRLDETLSKLQQRQIFRWFLSGAGVLLLGIIIGVGTRPKRRRSSLL